MGEWETGPRVGVSWARSEANRMCISVERQMSLYLTSFVGIANAAETAGITDILCIRERNTSLLPTTQLALPLAVPVASY